MYVAFETYQEFNPSSEMTEDEYKRLSSLADAIIDDWTLDRVGRAVYDGEELPQRVTDAYCTVIEAIPAFIESAKQAGQQLTSFSNGIDSYGFDTSKTASEQLNDSVSWIMGLLPVEWISGVVSYKGGNDAR